MDINPSLQDGMSNRFLVFLLMNSVSEAFYFFFIPGSSNRY